MQYKVKYQEEQKIKSIILEANSIQDLKSLKNYPNNIISVKKVTMFISLNSLSYSKTNNKRKVYELFSQLNMMLGANLSFYESIELIAKSNKDKEISLVLECMRSALSSSIPLDESLFKHKKYLGETVLLFLKLGFQNGNIKDAVNSLVEILYEDMKSKEKFQEVMRYPLILICSLFISLAMIFIYVLPNFDFLFQLLEGNIPLSTQILLGIRDILQYHSVFVILSLCAVILMSILFIRYNKEKLDKVLLLDIPILSKVIQSYYFYRLFLSISIIVKSKYQFQLAITNSKNIVNNFYIQEKMNQIIATIQNGSSIAQAFEQSALFDSLTIKLLYTAEHTNEYDKILNDITSVYKKQFQKSLKNFSSFVEPLLILIISLIVLWLILAIMLPIWNLGSVIN